jgi:hypothetical protein
MGGAAQGLLVITLQVKVSVTARAVPSLRSTRIDS